ncbi:C-type lectin domain family 4 member M-like [Asterias rubens]|uniref:C-type lectin domain family 4 member M-like n=1 Tax=Asterias rubens TaxID=7604 RepID=UPI001455526D|nr:C-type lectin domain family 4 member M-like [Asterias rubens]
MLDHESMYEEPSSMMEVTVSSRAKGTWVCYGGGSIGLQDKRWEDGQPDGGDDCAKGLAAGWNDYDCGVSQRLICQRPVAPL